MPPELEELLELELEDEELELELDELLELLLEEDELELELELDEELLLEDELDELLIPVSNWPGTLTIKASTREPPALLVQIKYFPVTSRLPLGSLL
jgi:hypothetical protein